TNAPRRLPSIGLVDRPPPTHRSYPGSPRSLTTPTKATSLISWMAHCAAQPLIEVLNLRGRLENAESPMYWLVTVAISGAPSMISSASTPASGQPRITRGVSPQASVVDSP